MIGSTNHLNKLDPAISKRPSRFDRKYHFNLPGVAERAAYAAFWRQKLIGSDMVDFRVELCELIAKLTEGFSFAYLKELFVIVLLTIARGGTGDEVEEEEEDASPAAPGSSPSEDGEVVEHEDAKGESGNDAEKEDEDKEKGKEAEKPAPPPKVKRVIPEVAVPESLQNNLLLKVTKGQIKMLLNEMGDSEDKDREATAQQPGGAAAVKLHPPPSIRRQRARKALVC